MLITEFLSDMSSKSDKSWHEKIRGQLPDLGGKVN